MKLFLDTNVLLDYAVNRNDNREIIQSVIKSCIDRKNEGFITSHSITDFFYIARNYFTNNERKEFTEFIVNTFTILVEDKEAFLNCLKEEHFEDFEDQLQMECAATAEVDYIITENKKDFEFAKVPVISGREFLMMR